MKTPQKKKNLTWQQKNISQLTKEGIRVEIDGYKVLREGNLPRRSREEVAEIRKRVNRRVIREGHLPRKKKTSFP